MDVRRRRLFLAEAVTDSANVLNTRHSIEVGAEVL